MLLAIMQKSSIISVASYLGDKNVKVLNYGQKRVYTDQIPLKEILKDNRMTVDQIVEDVKNA